MTRLLVSVRDSGEASDALAGGARVLDIKEPSSGALGRAAPSVWREVVQVVDNRADISVALGELLEQVPPSGADLQGVRFAKVGLAGCRRVEHWVDRCREFWRDLRQFVTPVAVVYVDELPAQAPGADEVLEAVSEWGGAAVLFDTYDKSAGGLFDHWSVEQLRDRVSQARARGWLTVVGGSLTRAHLSTACRAAPDLVAVRGAACNETRTGRVDLERVAQLAAELRQSPGSAEPLETSRDNSLSLASQGPSRV